jgi:hypothetical protein
MKRDLITFVLICISFYIGLTLNNDRDDKREQQVREHTIATFEPSPLNCKEDGMIKGIRQLAENGAHMTSYEVWVNWTNEEGQ